MNGDSQATGAELASWVRRLTLGLAHLPHPPSRVEAHMACGLSLRLHDADGSALQLIITRRQNRTPTYFRGLRTAMGYSGDADLPPRQERWLRGLCRALLRVERQPGWETFLKEAERGVPVHGAQAHQRVTSGDAVLLRVTTSCQAKCEFCNATGMLHDLVTDLPAVRARAAQAARMGCRTVSFTGGEPTLRRDLPLLIATARDEGIGGVELQTNGILLARKALVARLAEAGLSSIFLSLHSKDAALHDALLQVPGAHAKALLGACHVADRGVRVAVNHVITTHNMADLPSFMTQLAARLGPVRVTLSYMAPQGEGAKRLLWMPRLGEAAAMMARAIDRGKALGVEVRIPGLCGIPACLLPGYEDHFEELHDRVPPPRLVSRRQVPACQDCPHRERCSGFWNAYLDRFGEQELRPRLVPP